MAHSKVISGEAAEAGTGVSPRYIYAGLKSRLASWPESTGKGDWFTGPDGVDRYEIDDSQSRFDDERLDRKSDVKGKSVAIRVDLGGGRIIQKQIRKNQDKKKTD